MGGGRRHIQSKLQNVDINSYLISNFIKCKWIKDSNQKVETGKMDKNQNNHNPTRCYLQETVFRFKDTRGEGMRKNIPSNSNSERA